MSTVSTRPPRAWSRIALTGVASVVVAGTTLLGVVVTHHGGGDPGVPVPSAPASTAVVIPIPVAPTDAPVTEVVAAPRVVRRGR
jgi:hypothetical protein